MSTSRLLPALFAFLYHHRRLRGKVTMLYIAHQVPKGLRVDAAVELGAAAGTGPPTYRQDHE